MRAVRCAVGVKPVRQCTKGRGPRGQLRFENSTRKRARVTDNMVRLIKESQASSMSNGPTGIKKVLDVFPSAYTCGEVAGLYCTCTEPIPATGVKIPPKLSKWSIMQNVETPTVGRARGSAGITARRVVRRSGPRSWKKQMPSGKQADRG